MIERFKKLPFIQIFTAMYVMCIAVYMTNNQPTDSWKNYYWIVNKMAMLMAISFNFKKDKSPIDWLFINFLFLQTCVIVLYFAIGLPLFVTWMKMNDAVIYSFFMGSFLALCLMWYNTLRGAKK